MALPIIYTPGVLPLTLLQGSVFSMILEIVDNATEEAVDLTGLSAESQIRSAYNGPVLMSFTIGSPLTDNGRVELSLTVAQTRSIMIPNLYEKAINGVSTLGVWDLDLVDGADRVRVIGGTTALSLEVTR